MPAIVLGFIAMFWHFACWLGVLFAAAASAAYWIYHHWAFETFKETPTEQSQETR
jgi:hypothetical protein